MQLKAYTVAIAFVVSSSSAIACTANENFDIYFSRNSDEIANDEIIRLANWVVDRSHTPVTRQATAPWLAATPKKTSVILPVWRRSALALAWY